MALMDMNELRAQWLAELPAELADDDELASLLLSKRERLWRCGEQPATWAAVLKLLLRAILPGG